MNPNLIHIFEVEVFDLGAEGRRTLGLYQSLGGTEAVLEAFAAEQREDEEPDDSSLFKWKVIQEFTHNPPHQSGALWVRQLMLGGTWWEATVIRFEVRP